MTAAAIAINRNLDRSADRMMNSIIRVPSGRLLCTGALYLMGNVALETATVKL